MSLSLGTCSTSSERVLKIWIFIEISLLFNWSQASTAVWLSSLLVTNSSVMVSGVIGSTNVGKVVIVALSISFTHTVWRVRTVSILSCSVSSHLNGLTDEIVVGKFLIDGVEHALMFRFLIIDLVSHHDEVFVVFEHTVSVSSMILD